jgi:phage-related protein
MNHEKQIDHPALANISWEGNSLDVLKGWPREIQRDFGMSLLKLQEGERPNLAARPMQSIGRGVFELKAADEAAW